MKTNEQIKKEVTNYLEKTTNHLFIKPKATFKWGNENKSGYYEYDYQNFTYFKIFKKENDYYILEDGKVKKIDIDYYIKYWNNNSMCVISNNLFLNKKMKSIKQNLKNLDEIKILIE